MQFSQIQRKMLQFCLYFCLLLVKCSFLNVIEEKNQYEINIDFIKKNILVWSFEANIYFFGKYSVTYGFTPLIYRCIICSFTGFHGEQSISSTLPYIFPPHPYAIEFINHGGDVTTICLLGAKK